MKKFLLKISYTIFPVWLIIVGIVLYLSIYAGPRMSGDIGKLAFIPFGNEYNAYLNQNMPKDTLFKTINSTEILSSIHVDVLTIGDSFSQQNNGGYQNYLSIKGYNIANCYHHLYNNPIQYAYNLLDRKNIDSTNVRVLVVEVVERDIEWAFVSFEKNKIELPINANGGGQNEWSVSRARDFILFKLGIESPIYKARLKNSFFSIEGSRDLYFYYEDVDTNVSINKENEKKIYNTLGLLIEKASDQGIKLILMVAVDKYDLYQTQIENNKYPTKTVNEDLERIIGSSPNLYLTKKSLLPLINRGEMDVFMANDTHWSYKASAVIADEIDKRIVKNGFLRRGDGEALFPTHK